MSIVNVDGKYNSLILKLFYDNSYNLCDEIIKLTTFIVYHYKLVYTNNVFLFSQLNLLRVLI